MKLLSCFTCDDDEDCWADLFNISPWGVYYHWHIFKPSLHPRPHPPPLSYLQMNANPFEFPCWEEYMKVTLSPLEPQKTQKAQEIKDLFSCEHFIEIIIIILSYSKSLPIIKINRNVKSGLRSWPQVTQPKILGNLLFSRIFLNFVVTWGRHRRIMFKRLLKFFARSL